MNTKNQEELLRILGLKGSEKILTFLSENGTARYCQFSEIVKTISTLNKRLRQLRDFDLIEHHFERGEGRKEWYELTEVGKEVCKILKRLISLIEG